MEYVASTIQRLMGEEGGHRRTFLISTYVIGKERILLAVRADTRSSHHSEGHEHFCRAARFVVSTLEPGSRFHPGAVLRQDGCWIHFYAEAHHLGQGAHLLAAMRGRRDLRSTQDSDCPRATLHHAHLDTATAVLSLRQVCGL